MKLLDLRSGGGLLLLAAALSFVVIGWRVLPLFGKSGHAIGDGRNVASYGFDLSTTVVPAKDIVASGLAKDELHALNDPPTMPVAGVAEFNAAHRGKYLVSDDRVVGVVIAGEARAFPLRLLNWHEVINDTLGGVPIAVTYHPLCDSVVVFDRRAGGRTLSFGVSGLLLDSNLLMFDRQDGGSGESLWSQLRARAIAGPAARAAQTLSVLPASVAFWQDWVDAYPHTTVVRPEEALFKRYRRNPYGNYYLTGKLRFPVEPLPPEDEPSWMTRVLVVEDETSRRVLPLRGASLRNLPEVAQTLGATVRVASADDARDPALVRGDATSLLVEAKPGTRTYHSLWFAWYASHPETAMAALEMPVPHPLTTGTRSQNSAKVPPAN